MRFLGGGPGEKHGAKIYTFDPKRSGKKSDPGICKIIPIWRYLE
jgi:hypothetical protein